MRLQELITRLQREFAEQGDVEVLLHVTNHGGMLDNTDIDAIGDVTTVATEFSHDGEDMPYVCICGDDEE